MKNPNQPVCPYCRRRRLKNQNTKTLNLPCGCVVKAFSGHGLEVTYCDRHSSFIYSPHDSSTAVIYFVTEEDKP